MRLRLMAQLLTFRLFPENTESIVSSYTQHSNAFDGYFAQINELTTVKPNAEASKFLDEASAIKISLDQTLAARLPQKKE